MDAINDERPKFTNELKKRRRSYKLGQKTQEKWYHRPPASNGVKGAVTREQVAKTSDVH